MRLADYGNDFFRALNGCCLTTAEITYHLPDHPLLLQTYVWQEFDLPPLFPRLTAFIEFWHKNIDGRIETVRVMTAGNLVSHSISMPAISLEIH
ncbi:MAG: hypothetical protein V4482_04545 [Pseudomonadota bacterium]